MRKMVERQSLIDKLTKMIALIDEDSIIYVSKDVYIESNLEVENEIFINGPLILEGTILMGDEINHFARVSASAIQGGDEIRIPQSINLLYPFSVEFIHNGIKKWYEMWYKDGHLNWIEHESGETGNFDEPNNYPRFCAGISVGNLYELGESNCLITIEGQTDITAVSVTYYTNNFDFTPHLYFQAGAF